MGTGRLDGESERTERSPCKVAEEPTDFWISRIVECCATPAARCRPDGLVVVRECVGGGDHLGEMHGYTLVACSFARQRRSLCPLTNHEKGNGGRLPKKKNHNADANTPERNAAGETQRGSIRRPPDHIACLGGDPPC